MGWMSLLQFDLDSHKGLVIIKMSDKANMEALIKVCMSLPLCNQALTLLFLDEMGITMLDVVM